MVDHQVREDRPIFLWNQLHEILLDLVGTGLLCETKPRGDTLHVRVHYYPFVYTERVAEHDVGGLASDAGNLHQLSHGSRNRVVVPLCQRLTHPDQRFRLVPEESG